MPLIGWTKGWTCDSWCRSTRQVKALAGKAPCSGSLAVPEKLNVWPPLKRVPAAGLVMVPCGALLLVTVRRALLLVADPNALVTIARNVAPLSPSVGEPSVKV